MIICAGEKEQFPFAISMGIGLIDVAMNLTQYCMVKRPPFILFVGTAGSYGKHQLFDIIESQSATNIENSFLMPPPIHRLTTRLSQKMMFHVKQL